MTLVGAMRVSSTGMTAERFRMNVIAENLANANAIGVGGQPFLRRSVYLRGDRDGVEVLAVRRDPSPPFKVYDPGNPYADADGMVAKSNVEPIREMVDLVGASRSYEANVAAFNSAKKMMQAAMQIGRV
jgi:flagellar basal-body rod protein FlgC